MSIELNINEDCNNCPENANCVRSIVAYYANVNQDDAYASLEEWATTLANLARAVYPYAYAYDVHAKALSKLIAGAFLLGYGVNERSWQQSMTDRT